MTKHADATRKRYQIEEHESQDSAFPERTISLPWN